MEIRDESYMQQRIAEETAKIKVDSYQKTASLGGWAGGARTLWAIAAVGAGLGTIIGLVAPFLPLIAGASSFAIAASAIPASVAAFASVGMGMGFTGGLLLGRISGSNAAVAEEQEKRLKEWATNQIVRNNPGAVIEETKPLQPMQEKKSFRQKLSDTYHTYFNPRVGLAFAAIGVVGGLIMAAAFFATGGATGPIMPALEQITGLGTSALTPGVITAYTAGVMGAFGALFSFNVPKVVSATTELSGNILSGKALGREWGPKQPAQEKPVPETHVNEEMSFAGSTTSPRQKTYTSFQQLVISQQSENTVDRAKS